MLFISAPISVHNHLLLVSPADNLCKPFGPRSDPTKRFKRKVLHFCPIICPFCWLFYSSEFSCRTELVCSLILAFSDREESVIFLFYSAAISFQSSVSYFSVHHLPVFFKLFYSSECSCENARVCSFV